MQIGQTLYLDYQATTPLDPQVYKAMEPYNTISFANPHSAAHVLGQKSAAAVDKARADIEAFINAKEEELIFTSGATESNNQAIATVLYANRTDKNKILISTIEHKCIKNAAYFYAEKLGCVVEEVPVLASGLIDQDAYQSMLSDDVVLVCIMAVNNEIGTIQDIKTLAAMAHEYGAVFHCDAAQAPEALDIDVVEWGVDMLSLSAHKIYGPKGIGALFIKNRLQATLPPLIQGGGQQYGMRSGTVPTPLCVGFAEAVNLAKQSAPESRSLLAALKQRFISKLTEAGVKFSLNGSQDSIHPGNMNIQFHDIDNGSDLIEAMQPNLCASTGSACNSDMVLPSHVLKALGLNDEQVLQSIRFSLGRFVDEAQVDQASGLIAESIEKLITKKQQ